MFRVDEIVKITEGKLIQGSPAAKVKGVSIDSRTLRKGDLFIAIKGECFDGHNFISQAVRKGASAIVIQKRVSVKRNFTVIKVSDAVKALGYIAKSHRSRFNIPVIAITGSAGKTTTKEMVAGILQTRYKVLKNKVSYNNHIGVPLTLLNLKASHQVAVLELGTNQPGDIRWLTQIADPSVAVLTNIGESHLERLKSPSGVLKEKMSLVRNAKNLKAVVYNRDDPRLKSLKKLPKGIKWLSFGIRNKADVQADRIRETNRRHLEFTVNRSHIFCLKSTVYDNIYNAITAICCGRLFKISYNNMIRAISRFKTPAGRQVIQKMAGIWVINDTYNANPVSFRSSLKTLNHLQVPGRKILVCSDMLELGPHAKRLHALIGRLAGESGLDMVISVGKNARWISFNACKKNRNIESYHEASFNTVCSLLKKRCRPGDAVLIKGSRRMKMERALAALKRKMKN